MTRTYLVSFSFRKGRGLGIEFGTNNIVVRIGPPPTFVTMDTIRGIEKELKEQNGYDQVSVIALSLLDA